MRHLLYRNFAGDIDMRRRRPTPTGVLPSNHYGPQCVLCDRWWCVACGWSYEPWLTEDCPERVRILLRAKRAAAGLDRQESLDKIRNLP